MIFYASVRGHAAELAKHLLNAEENEHITVHDIRGFVADDLAGALLEAYAISRGSRCKDFLFSVSLNPPDYADVPIEDFEAAIEEIERKLSLVDRPRIIVFHEKNGRRHCHAVWLRLKTSAFDPRRIVGIPMSHFKYKLMDISRQLFLKYGWKMPEGMKKGPAKAKDPLHLSREVYRQAVRLAEDPQALKLMFRQSWETTDSKQAFARFLSENGFFLAQGERRGYVAVDLAGKVYSLTRWIDISTRDLKARLGPHEQLPTTQQARAFIAERMTESLKRYMDEVKAEAKEKRLPLVQEIRLMTAQHRKERTDLIVKQEQRHKEETKVRVARFARGVAGMWERATGEYQKKCALNAAEIKACFERDRKELHTLVRSQLIERLGLEKTVQFYREEHRQETARIRREIAHYISTATEPKAALPPSSPAAAGGAIEKPAPSAQEIREAKGEEFTRIIEKLPITVQLAQVEAKIGLMSGDLSTLQAVLESNLLSDEMRGRIRRLVEKTLETLHLKAMETKTAGQKAEEKEREYRQKQAEFNEYVRQYALLQMKVEEEIRRQETNRAFYAVIKNMSYALNGLPAWRISVMPPPEDRRLDEKAFIQTVRQRDNTQLLDRVFRSPENESLVSRRPPIDPKIAVPNLRANVLQVTELLGRAGLRPSGGGSRFAAPARIRTTAESAASRFNTVRR